MNDLANLFFILIGVTVSGCVLILLFLGLQQAADLFPDFLASIRRCQKAWREFMEDNQ